MKNKNYEWKNFLKEETVTKQVEKSRRSRRLEEMKEYRSLEVVN